MRSERTMWPLQHNTKFNVQPNLLAFVIHNDNFVIKHAHSFLRVGRNWSVKVVDVFSCREAAGDTEMRVGTKRRDGWCSGGENEGGGSEASHIV